MKWETTRINDYLLPNDGTWLQGKRKNVYNDKKMKLKGTYIFSSAISSRLLNIQFILAFLCLCHVSKYLVGLDVNS